MQDGDRGEAETYQHMHQDDNSAPDTQVLAPATEQVCYHVVLLATSFRIYMCSN